ncbi:MAG: D-amino-acid transaminase [Caulobacterales bacterium]|nr:D-amino-acid transaminase [Caulobacterales bacterium]
MSDVVYLNDRYVAAEDARVSVYDRGFLFADAVYEVSAVLSGRLIDVERHLARLSRSLRELRISPPKPDAELIAIQKELVTRNQLDEGLIYLQVSRGAAPRDFPFPADAAPTLVMFPMRKAIRANPRAETGVRVITTPDIRWRRCDVKTVGLLAAVLASQAARDAGVEDAWFTDGEHVTEGSSNNAFILTRDRVIVTRHLSNEILPGVTRRAVLSLAAEEGLAIEERPFTVAEAMAAAEAFSTSASSFVMPVVEIDGRPIGDGRPGPVARALRARYVEMAEAAGV